MAGLVPECREFARRRLPRRQGEVGPPARACSVGSAVCSDGWRVQRRCRASVPFAASRSPKRGQVGSAREREAGGAPSAPPVMGAPESGAPWTRGGRSPSRPGARYGPASTAEGRDPIRGLSAPGARDSSPVFSAVNPPALRLLAEVLLAGRSRAGWSRGTRRSARAAGPRRRCGPALARTARRPRRRDGPSCRRIRR